MNILIPSLQRARTHTTSKLLDSQGVKNYFYVLDNGQEADDYIEEGLSRSRVVICPTYKTLPEKRLFLTEYCKAKGWERYLSLDDDIKYFSAPKLGDTEKVRAGEIRLMENRANINELISHIGDDETPLVGFGVCGNSYFRKKQFSLYGKISASAMVIRPEKSTLYRDKRFSNVEENDFTLQVIAENGFVKRYNYLYFEHSMFSIGGLCVSYGGVDGRSQIKRDKEIPMLIDKYGRDFLSPMKKHGVNNSEPRFNVTGKNVDFFRERYFSIGKKSVEFV